MRMINALIACVLLVLAVLHAFVPNHLSFFFVYAAGAIFALVTIKPGRMSINTARLFAIGTTVVMFFYFAGFFRLTPHFQGDWMRTGVALEGFGMLLSGFLMIPILSCYSCLLKAEGCEHFKHQTEETKRGAFFSAPEDIQENH